jgi:DivIVA domain-containing protein
MGGPPMGGPGSVPPGDLQRIDMLRRTFQPRRFGSGYDPVQVDRLFEGIVTAMAGRGPMPISEAEIDTARFGLVPGGYFEAEVDAALKEVRDILRRS